MIALSDLHNFYDALPVAARAAIDAASTYRDEAPGTIVMREGQMVRQVFQIVHGDMKVFSCGRDGRETVITLLRDGDWLSVAELLSDLPASVGVTAMTPVRLRGIGATAFKRLMREHPEIAERLLRVMSRQLNLLCGLIADRAMLSLRERVVKTLFAQALGQSPGRGTSGPVKVALSQQELAKLLAISRQNLNKVLKELEREGVLEIGYGSVVLREPEQIRRRFGHLVDVDQPAAVYRNSHPEPPAARRRGALSRS